MNCFRPALTPCPFLVPVQLTYLLDDPGVFANWRAMEGHSVNTYTMTNADGKESYVKFIWMPKGGEATYAGPVHCHSWHSALGQARFTGRQSLTLHPPIFACHQGSAPCMQPLMLPRYPANVITAGCAAFDAALCFKPLCRAARPPAGPQYLSDDEVPNVGDLNWRQSHATHDLYHAIEAGNYPEYELSVQVRLVQEA